MTDGKESAESKQPNPVDLANRDPSVPKIYANGFSMGLGNADTQIALMLNGRPIALVNLSYTLAKSLFVGLQQMVQQFEKQVGRNMLTSADVDAAFQKQSTSEEGSPE